MKTIQEQRKELTKKRQQVNADTYKLSVYKWSDFDMDVEKALQDRASIAKEEWLREEIKKLKVSEVKNGTIQKWYGREEFITEDEADGFNAAIATIIDRYQKELDEITNK